VSYAGYGPAPAINGGQTSARRHVLCGSSSWIAVFQIDSELSPHMWCLFHLSTYLHEFGRLQLVATDITRFVVRRFMQNLHCLLNCIWHYKTDFATLCCFFFCQWLFYWTNLPITPSTQRSFVSGIVKKHAFNQNKNRNIIANRNAGNCPYSQNFGPPWNRGPRPKPF